MTTGSVGFIGLGKIGRPMAESLLDKGFELVGYDVNPAATAGLQREGFSLAFSVAEVAEQCEIVVLSLPSSHNVEDVIEGPAGILERRGKVRYIIDEGTSIPEITRRLWRRLADEGIGLVDAPVSGGLVRAREGDLTLMVGGEAEDIAAVMPVLKGMGSNVVHMGPSSAGHVTKLVNNLILGVNMAVAAEALVLGASAGVNPQTLIEVIQTSTGASQVLNARGWRLVKGEYEPAHGRLDIMCKDFTAIMALSQEFKVSLPLGAATAELYKIGSKLNHGSKDYAAIGLVYEHLAGAQLLKRDGSAA